MQVNVDEVAAGTTTRIAEFAPGATATDAAAAA